tara:strand:+ start:365 stop:1045 length:681 start_codon:yes stop_codon:yes gene_type:complete
MYEKNEKNEKKISLYNQYKLIMVATIKDCTSVKNIIKGYYSKDKEKREKIRKKYGNIEDWDISQVKSLDGAFRGINDRELLDLDLNNWNTSNVENINQIFCDSNFDGNISNWDTSNVKSSCLAFKNTIFEGDISNWNLEKLEDSTSMFENSIINCDLSRWKLIKIRYMPRMFYCCRKDIGDLGQWTIHIEPKEVSQEDALYGTVYHYNPPYWYMPGLWEREVLKNR